MGHYCKVNYCFGGYTQKKCWSSGEYPFQSLHELLTCDYMTWSEKQLYPSLSWSYTCNFPVQRGNIPNFASTLTECSSLHQSKSGECEQDYWGCMWPEVKGWWRLLDSLLHDTLAPPSFPWLYLTLPHFDHGSSYLFLLPNWLNTTLYHGLSGSPLYLQIYTVFLILSDPSLIFIPY